MKILLCRPYYGVIVQGDFSGDIGHAEYNDNIFPDLSLVYSASLAKSLNMDLTVIDANAEQILPDKLIKRINVNYDIVIIKASAPSIQLDIEFVKLLKKKFKFKKIVLSGYIACILNKWVKNNLRGVEVADIYLEDYIYFLATGNKKHLTLDELPVVDYSLFPYKKYMAASVNNRATLYGSRGCNNRCSYCPYTSYNRLLEIRSLPKLRKDIENVMSLGMNSIHFRDQNFSLSKKRTLEICDIMKGLKKKDKYFEWICETKIENLSKEVIEAMIDAKVQVICFGVESSSKNILKKYRRTNLAYEKIKEITSFLHKNKIFTLGFYIIGFPEDTLESIQSTYELSEEINTSWVQFNIWCPFPDTDNWKEKKFNIKPNPELFVPFENIINIPAMKDFSINDLLYIRDNFNFMYNMKKNGLDSAFMNIKNEKTNKAEQLVKVNKSIGIIDKLRKN